MMTKKIKALLKELEKNQTKFWNISSETGQFLNFFIKDRHIQKVLEIGSSNGYSGIWLAEAISETKGHLYTIESHKERFALAKKNFLKSELEKHITQIPGHAPEDLPDTPENFDLAFFDATKFEHIQYFEKLKSRINKNGFIITDNIISHKEQLHDFIKTLTTAPGWDSYTLNIGTGLLISAHNSQQ